MTGRPAQRWQALTTIAVAGLLLVFGGILVHSSAVAANAASHATVSLPVVHHGPAAVVPHGESVGAPYVSPESFAVLTGAGLLVTVLLFLGFGPADERDLRDAGPVGWRRVRGPPRRLLTVS